MLDRLDRVRIVLVETTHPGNIGAAARAMKTMGLAALRLVNPKHFPDPEAEARASGAEDVLAAARCEPSLDAAVADCTRVIGTSARQRTTGPSRRAAMAHRSSATSMAALLLG